jgi:hypothetical protein
VPCGQQEFTQIADVIVVMVSDEHMIDVVRGDARFHQLCCYSAPGIKQDLVVLNLNQKRRRVPLWIQDGCASAKQGDPH